MIGRFWQLWSAKMRSQGVDIPIGVIGIPRFANSHQAIPPNPPYNWLCDSRSTDNSSVHALQGRNNILHHERSPCAVHRFIDRLTDVCTLSFS